MKENHLDLDSVKKRAHRPKKAVITAGMPYANGPLHLGHLAGAHIPADVYARYMRMLIGADNVLFVCGTDDHGSTSELAAMKVGKTTRQFIDEIHVKQQATLDRYQVSLDTYTGTSRPECFDTHREICQDFLRKLHANGMLEKKVSQQWFDTKVNRFLQDRFVQGKCPNPKCENTSAYSNECDRCGAQYAPTELQEPRSAISDTTPVLKDTIHWFLDMWKVSETLRVWIQGKEKTWRSAVFSEVINTVLPSLAFSNVHEEKYKELKTTLPKHKSKYAAGKKIQVQFENKVDLNQGKSVLEQHGIPSEFLDAWAHRSITRDVTWGIPLPKELGSAEEIAGKSLYVWPDSLIAPISFSQVALKKKGRSPEEFKKFWQESDTKVAQFLGQDNVYFYVLMQGALWVGTQQDPSRLPTQGDYQLTDIFGCFHLLVDGEKMSKSRGNFFTGDQLLEEKGYSIDQVRYFLTLLSLPEKMSNFDFENFKERNKFLAGPLNASFEKPISACHSKYNGVVPHGVLLEKVEAETVKIVQRYLRSMERAEYSTLLFAIENYARQVNSLFVQYKPHDDRFPEQDRNNALFSCFAILKNMMIMLYPFVPGTMDKLRQSLNLPESIFTIDELGVPMAGGHKINAKQEYFPLVEGQQQE